MFLIAGMMGVALAQGVGSRNDGLLIDTLGGVKIGTDIERSKWHCEGSSCRMSATIAGLAGTLEAFICGNMITSVHFHRTYVITEPFYHAPEVIAQLKSDGRDAVSLTKEGLTSDYQTILSASESQGWRSFELPTPEGFEFMTGLTHADGRARNISLKLFEQKHELLTLRILTLTLAAGGNYPCTVGL